MAIPRFMLVLGALTLCGQVPLFRTLRSLVDDICHVDVTGRVNIVNKAPEYCAVHPKCADGQPVAKKPGSGAFVPPEPPSASNLCWPDQMASSRRHRGNILPLIRRRGCRGVRAVCRPG